MNNVLSMCSTFKRPELFLQMAESYSRTVKSSKSMLVAYVSEDDPKISEYMKLKLPNKVSIEYGRKKTMVQVLNYFSCEKYTDYNYYSEVNDDHIYVTPGWDVTMMKAIDSKYNGMSIAYGKTESLPTATTHGEKLVHGLGYFFPPIYAHMLVDFWLLEVNKETNILTHVPDVVIDHRHPVFNKGKWDATYQDGEDELNKTANDLHKTWIEKNKKNDVTKIKTLIENSVCICSKDIPEITDNVTCFITTYDRLDLLEETINSYLGTKIRPNKLYVFDDGSKKFHNVMMILLRIPEVIIIKNDKNYGSDGNINQAMAVLFNKGAKVLLALDSDCLFAKKWWEKTNDLYKTLDLDKHLICLFNARVHKYIKSVISGLAYKEIIGGLGMLISKKIYNSYLRKIENTPTKLSGWDGKLCKVVALDNITILACSPSMIQHTGYKNGVHCNTDPIECVADDFEDEALPDIATIPLSIQQQIDLTRHIDIINQNSTKEKINNEVFPIHNLHPEKRPPL